jgi:hypothetical protein
MGSEGSPDVLGGILSEFRGLVTLLEAKLSVTHSAIDRDRLLDICCPCSASSHKLYLKLQQFKPSSPFTFDKLWNRHIIVEEGARIEIGTLYRYYLDHVGDFAHDTRVKLSQNLSGKGIRTWKSNGADYYKGIRLRTANDPLPQFPREIIPPHDLQALGHALVFARALPDDSQVSKEEGELIWQWREAHYVVCNPSDFLSETKILFDSFVSETHSTISLQQFESAMPALLDSLPTGLRWSLLKNDQTDIRPIEDNFSPSVQRTLASKKRRWTPLKQKQ